jgi:hypothetical protein
MCIDTADISSAPLRRRLDRARAIRGGLPAQARLQRSEQVSIRCLRFESWFDIAMSSKAPRAAQLCHPQCYICPVILLRA